MENWRKQYCSKWSWQRKNRIGCDTFYKAQAKLGGDSKGLKDTHPPLRIATSLSCVSRIVHFGYILFWWSEQDCNRRYIFQTLQSEPLSRGKGSLCVYLEIMSVWRDFLKRPAQRLWVEFSDEKTSRLAKEKLNWLRYILQSPSKATGDSKGLKDPTNLENCNILVVHVLRCAFWIHFFLLIWARLQQTVRFSNIPIWAS